MAIEAIPHLRALNPSYARYNPMRIKRSRWAKVCRAFVALLGGSYDPFYKEAYHCV